MKKGSFALRLFLYASLFSLVWLGGYVALSGIFAVPEEPLNTTISEITPTPTIPEPVFAQWSVLIVKDEEKDVTSFLLRYADFLADTLVFLDVPVDTKVELTAGGHEMLNVHNPEVPDLFMVSDLCRIFSEETWCMAAEEVGTVFLGTRPKETYIVDETVYDTITETVAGETRFLPMLSVKETIAAMTNHAVTNDTFRDELVYWESYQDVDRVLYMELPGEKFAEEFRPDTDAVRGMAERFRLGDFSESGR
ncbi:MAG: hypothetical protein IKB07_01230 [Lachnospiraceae bacterium]|nr:hypothetical protein [Lachnospiraceae bacterium]